MISVAEAVASRRSIRAFADTPVALEVIERVLDAIAAKAGIDRVEC